MKKGYDYSIYLLLTIGIIAASGLVKQEIANGDGCPKIGSVPACAIVLICFVIPLLVHILKKGNKLYFIFTGVAWAIGIFASFMQFTGKLECPKLTNGMPMCYLSFLLFSTLIVLKYLNLKYIKL